MRTKQVRSFNKKLFGQRLKKLREDLGIRQEDIGKALNRSRSSYVIIEAGKVAPSLDWVIDMLRYFRKHKIIVSLDYLVGETEDNLVETYRNLKDKYDNLLKDHDRDAEIMNLQKELLKTKK